MKKGIKKIVLIDDDAISSWLNQTLLERTGLVEQIEVISNGKDAIAFLQQHCSNAKGITNSCPDLILLDLDMPEVSGFDVLEALQNSEENAWLISERVIVLTTTINPKDLQRAKAYEVRDFLIKPLTETKLNELLSEHIRSTATSLIAQPAEDRQPSAKPDKAPILSSQRASKGN